MLRKYFSNYGNFMPTCKGVLHVPIESRFFPLKSQDFMISIHCKFLLEKYS